MRRDSDYSIVEIPKNSNGYEVVGEFVESCWKQNGYTDDVIVRVGKSYDGVRFEYRNELVSPLPNSNDDVEFLDDWWEGEPYIQILGIIYVKDVEVERVRRGIINK